MIQITESKKEIKDGRFTASYMIIEGEVRDNTDRRIFADKVSEYLLRGWQCEGGVSIVIVAGRVFYIQTLTRYEDYY